MIPYIIITVLSILSIYLAKKSFITRKQAERRAKAERCLRFIECIYDQLVMMHQEGEHERHGEYYKTLIEWYSFVLERKSPLEKPAPVRSREEDNDGPVVMFLKTSEPVSLFKKIDENSPEEVWSLEQVYARAYRASRQKRAA